MLFKNVELARGLSAVTVLLHHASMGIALGTGIRPLHGLFFELGWVGVDVFFVISGFIIYSSQMTLPRTQGAAMTYAKRRVIRIYPMYWFATLTVMSLLLLSQQPMNFGGRNTDGMKLVRDFLLIPDLQNMFPAGTYHAVGWTLVYEMFFYSFFLLAFFLSFRNFVICVAIWLLGIIINGSLFGFSGTLLDFFFSARNVEFICGMAIAWWVQHRQSSKSAGFLRVGIGVILFTVSAVYYMTDSSFLKSQYFGILLLGLPAALIVWGLVTLEVVGCSVGDRRVLTLGAATYSIYLFHSIFLSPIWRLLSVAHHRFGLPVDVMLLISGVVTLGLCLLVHRWIEKPVLRLLNSKVLKPASNGTELAR